MPQYYIGVDVGGTAITAGIVGNDFKILARATAETRLPRPESAIEGEIAKLCLSICIDAGVSFDKEIAWVGIGTPGSANPDTGVVEFNANFAYHNWHLQEALEKLLNKKVFIENDANAAAFGELLAGGAKGYKDAVVVTLGTGIGGGIILGGKLFSGHNHAGAEIGHMVIVKNGRPCMCGRKGCFEKYASARALTEDTKEAMRANPENMMWELAENDIEKVTAKTAFDAMRAGDPLGRLVVNAFLEYVACGVTNIINIFQPEVVCIGGGVSKEGEVLLGPVRAIVEREDYARTSAKRTVLTIAQLRNDAGLVGAAFLGTAKE